MNHLPTYPKRFFELANIAHDPTRVFVAMPFEAGHSGVLWPLIQQACQAGAMTVIRADELDLPGAIVQDILDQIGRAGIIIADLTGCNPNVMYELGIAHMRSHNVILISKRRQKLPFNLASLRCLFFDFSTLTGQEEFKAKLATIIEELKEQGRPTVLDTPESRTEHIIADLQTILQLPEVELRRQQIGLVASVSSFAFTKPEMKANHLLKQEHDLLVELAQKGCRVRCILSPQRIVTWLVGKEHAFSRARSLLAFLKGKDTALQNIELANSTYDEGNMFLIGSVACYLGYKANSEASIGMTLRMGGSEAIAAQHALFSALFERLKHDSLAWHLGDPSAEPTVANLRRAMIKCIEKSIKKSRTVAGQEPPKAVGGSESIRSLESSRNVGSYRGS